MAGYSVEERAAPHSLEYRLFFSECGWHQTPAPHVPFLILFLTVVSPRPQWGAHLGRTPGPRGCPAERRALPCRGRGRAVHLPLPRHPVVRGRRQGEGTAGV